jgi:hypothetical protein
MKSKGWPSYLTDPVPLTLQPVFKPCGVCGAILCTLVVALEKAQSSERHVISFSAAPVFGLGLVYLSQTLTILQCSCRLLLAGSLL